MTEESSGRTVVDADRPYFDPHLTMILGAVLGFEDEKHENSMGITLVTGGGVISGMAVTRRTWSLRQTERLEAAGVEVIPGALRSVEEKMNEPEWRVDEDGETLPLRRGFVNLRDAVVREGQQSFKFDSLRVDIREIIGWDISNFNVEE